VIIVDTLNDFKRTMRAKEAIQMPNLLFYRYLTNVFCEQ